MKISTSQFRNGLKIIINAQPCSILEHEFHKPGKGQAGRLSQGRPQTERAKAGLLDHHDERRIPCDVDLRTVVITRG